MASFAPTGTSATSCTWCWPTGDRARLRHGAPAGGMLAAVSFRCAKATGVAGLAVAMTAALGSASCALPDTSPRGFGSTQVLHVRQSALSLRVFGLDERSIYLAR